jgi:HEAT repeat protein
LLAKAIAMLQKPCPFCQKRIPRSITVCPYCHRDEHGKNVMMEEKEAPAQTAVSNKYFQDDLKELGSDDPFVRDQAVVRVAQQGFGVVQALISILDDLAKPGLASVAKVLGRIRDRRAIPALVQAAKVGDEDLRIAAVWALTQFREPEILPALLSEAERPHPVIQGYLAYVFGTYQDPCVVAVLGRLARNSSREVAFQAACALGETGDPGAVRALRRAAGRRDPIVREAAVTSLRRLGVTFVAPKRKALLVLTILAVAAGLCLWIILRVQR